jgi:hypothetical protein
MEQTNCPDCHHAWRAHQGRNGGERCVYRDMGHDCTCRRKNPDVAAEDRAAARAWNAFLGRTP